MSTLVLPPGVGLPATRPDRRERIAQNVAALKKKVSDGQAKIHEESMRRHVHAWRESIKGSHVTPGTLAYVPFGGDYLSEGGIVIVQCSADTPGTIKNCRYGVVLGCGISAIRDGTPVNYPNFPLPPGTIFEHTCINEYIGFDGVGTMRSAEVLRAWHHSFENWDGAWPKWFPATLIGIADEVEQEFDALLAANAAGRPA